MGAIIENLELPWPPSVNHYYRHVNGMVLISKDGREYRKKIESIIASLRLPRLEGKYMLVIEAYPPDNRKRDYDNIFKAMNDALEHAGLVENDNQFRQAFITMREPMKEISGLIVLSLYVYNPKRKIKFDDLQDTI